MTNLVKSELIKLFTIRTTYLLVLAGIGMSLLVIAGLPPQGSESATELQDELLVGASAAFPIVVALGALIAGGEFQHKTISQSLLFAPRPGRLLTAKLLAGAAGGLVISVNAVLVTTVAGAHALAQRGTHLPLDAHSALVVTSSIGSNLLWSGLGVALGALLRGQTLAIVATLIFTFAVDPVLQALAPAAWRFFPTALDQGLTQRNFSFASIKSIQPLDRPASLLVFLCWVAATVLAGAAVLGSRDIAH